MAHPELEVAQVAIEAISHLPQDQSRPYFDVILSAAPDSIRQILEAQMQGYKYQSEFAIRYYSQGEAAGLEQGLAKGRENGLQAAVLALARASSRR
jgi:flagellar biosynthesis/type III secretory pathway protein FliH